MDRRALRRALGSFLTGVTVVTTVDSSGRPRGLTANSFTSVSLDPPLVLVCVDHRSGSHDVFASCAHFVVNVLADDQRELAERFASRASDKFANLEYTHAELAGAPVLGAALAVIECEVHSRIDLGDHKVVVGRVLSFTQRDARPIGFFQGEFVSFGVEALLVQNPDDAISMGWLAHTDDALCLRRTQEGRMQLVTQPVSRDAVSDEALRAAARSALGADIGAPMLFSIYQMHARPGIEIVYRTVLETAPRSAGVELVKFDDLAAIEFASEFDRGIVARFVAERRSGVFGIYAGTAEVGRIEVLPNP